MTDRSRKTLHASAALIDATKVTEEILSLYGGVRLECATLLETARTHEVLSRCGAQISAACTLEVPENCATNLLNGNVRLGELPPPEKLTVLMVNGNLCVETGDTLRNYQKIIVNGTVLSPDDLGEAAERLMVNGVWSTYPAGAVLIERELEVDRAFIAQARPDALYYVTDRVRVVADGLDLAPLLDQRTRIQTDRALVREELLEDAAAILDERAEIRVVPAGWGLAPGGKPLNLLAGGRGGRLFIDGGLDLREEDRAALEAMEALEVTGKVTLPEAMQKLFCTKCQQYGELDIRQPDPAGCLSDWQELEVTAALLGEYPHGVRITDCGSVVFHPDIPQGLLREKVLSVSDCMTVRCTPEQKAVLLTRCGDIMGFKTEDEPVDPDVVVVRAALYTL